MFDVCSGTTWAAFILQWGNTISAFSISRRLCKRMTTPVHSWEMVAMASVSEGTSCICSLPLIRIPEGLEPITATNRARGRLDNNELT